MSDEQQAVQDDGDLRKYRIELPNMADDDLDVYEFRLYAHYKRVCGAGNGVCFEGVRTTAKKCQMSVGQVVKTRESLTVKGWIKIDRTKGRSLHITIVDRWLENFARYSERSPHEQTRSPGERKKELFKKSKEARFANATATPYIVEV